MSVVVVGASGTLGAVAMASLAAVTDQPITPAAHGGPFGNADTVVHLLAGDHDVLAAARLSAVQVTADALAAATEAGVTHFVMLSSAMVYGAWASNPIPLTEDSPVRPGDDFDFATQLAQAELMVDQWRMADRARRVCVLRPTLTLGRGGASSSIVRALAAGMGLQLDEEDAPAQFVHTDDCAAAVALAVAKQLDGVFNVAPDGWIDGPRVRALSGQTPRLRLPARLAEPVLAWSWRFQRGPIPPGLRPYVRFPWLVANDRLRSHGWVPTVTNEQAYVEGTEERWWTMLTPKRKQELSLGLSAVAALGSVLALIRWIRKARRRGRTA